MNRDIGNELVENRRPARHGQTTGACHMDFALSAARYMQIEVVNNVCIILLADRYTQMKFINKADDVCVDLLSML